MKKPFNKRKFDPRPRREGDRKKNHGEKREWRKDNDRPEKREHRGGGEKRGERKDNDRPEKREWKKDDRGKSESRPWKKRSDQGGRYANRNEGPRKREESRPWKKREEGQRESPDRRNNSENRGSDRPWKKRDDQGGRYANRNESPRKREESRPWKKREEGRDERPDRKNSSENRGSDRPWKKREEGQRESPDSRDNRGSDRPWQKRDTTRWHGGKNDRIRKREQNLKKAFEKSAKNSSLSSGPGTPQSPGQIRLNKYLSNAGICSRREADKFIGAGVVTVNGKIITELGYKVSPGDRVQFGGNKVHKEKTVYILLNKPKGFITTCDDPEERDTVMDLIKEVPERVYPVGRLDRGTTGLLLLTNDGDMAKFLMHPKYKVAKVYHVELDRPLKAEDLDKIRTGIELEDGFIKPDDVAYVDGAETKKEVGIEIHSGRNRIVRRIFESLGYVVIKLDRVFYAGLTKKTLSRGRWRYLEENEVRLLKKIK